MIQVMKNQGKTVHAYRLGQPHPVLDELMNKKQIVDLHNGRYEVFSQEAVNGNSGHGQLAEAGDWIRIDGAGYPYPSRDDWFRASTSWPTWGSVRRTSTLPHSNFGIWLKLVRIVKRLIG